jgi:hypothetical protein
MPIQARPQLYQYLLYVYEITLDLTYLVVEVTFHLISTIVEHNPTRVHPVVSRDLLHSNYTLQRYGSLRVVYGQHSRD